jgi:hypothetical protein
MGVSGESDSSTAAVGSWIATIERVFCTIPERVGMGNVVPKKRGIKELRWS